MQKTYQRYSQKFWRITPFFFITFFFLISCAPSTPVAQISLLSTPTAEINPTPEESRPTYKPGELVAYTVQSGDTMPALARRFNTTVDEIRAANTIIPQDVTTLPTGMPMEIPIYYLPLWGSQYQIIPNSDFVNGPSAVGFDTQGFVDAYPGWLKDVSFYAGGKTRTGAELVDFVALNFSVSPRLLLALLEYQAGALTNPEEPNTLYHLGYEDPIGHRGLYLQMTWAANALNNGYYGWRTGKLTQFEHGDGSIERPDPWQNAASVGVQYYLSRTMPKSAYERAISPDGVAATYQQLFGNPWVNETELIPGLLEQPEFLLPFPRGSVWTYTGAPHTGWGKGAPFAGIDFAPPSTQSGCFVPSESEFAAAMAAGIVSRVNTGLVILDLDMDADERTGWVTMYLHIATEDRISLGTIVNAGDYIGYPSCEGGSSTGTHIHIARKYNGEWMVADSPVAFNMEGWVTRSNGNPYQGTLMRDGFVVTASDVSDAGSRIQAAE